MHIKVSFAFSLVRVTVSPPTLAKNNFSLGSIIYASYNACFFSRILNAYYKNQISKQNVRAVCQIDLHFNVPCVKVQRSPESELK